MSRRRVTAWDRLTPPAEDAAVLAVPPLEEWGRLVDENRRSRTRRQGEILGRPWSAWTEDPGRRPPVIMTGHQPGFIHPGVWIKAVGIDLVAARLGGRADFVIADTDAADDLALAIPLLNGARLDILTSRPLGMEAGVPYQRLPAIPPQWWQDIDRKLQQSRRAGTACSPWEAFTTGYVAGTSDTSLSGDHVRSWTAGLRASQAALGLTSPAFSETAAWFSFVAGDEQRPAAALVAHLLLEAGRFASAHNEAVGAYRARRGLRGRAHPVPDLSVETDRVETPFWIALPTGPRKRLWAGRRRSDRVELWADAALVSVLEADAMKRDPPLAISRSLPPGTAIWPRALTLTMFLRLFCCDLFVHGVGGAKYDQITDDLMQRFLGVEPPHYVALSATLRLPLPRSGRSAEELKRQQRRVRDLRFNPQRYLPAGQIAAVADLLSHRAALIAQADELRDKWRRARPARRAVWQEIREANRRLAALLADEEAQTTSEMGEIHKALASDRLAESREWFFALHPGDRLRQLVGALDYQR